MKNLAQVIDDKVTRKHLITLTKYASVLVLLSYSWMFKAITVPNERTRIYLSVAIVDHGTVSIDRPVRRFGKTADMAKYDGHLFTDKAPGTGFLGAVVYGFVRLFSTSDSWNIFSLVNLMRTFLMLPCAMLAFFVFRRLLFFLGITSDWVDMTSFFWILGTSAFHYSTAFYGHQLAAIGFLVSFLFISKSEGEDSAPYKMIFAGMGCGFSGLMEYQSVIPAFFILVYVIVRRRNLVDIVCFIGGASPFALLLLGYNASAFDGPFELSYHHLASKKVQSLHSLGIGGVSFPKKVATIGALFSLHRGLITTSPLFILIPWGVWRMYSSHSRGIAILIGLIVAYYMMFVFGADAWYAGWSFGPRLLVPMMGVAMIPVAFAVTHLSTKSVWLNGIVVGLGVWGVLYHQFVHFVFPELPETAQNPFLDIVLPAISVDTHSPNLLSSISGAYAWWQIIPLVCLVVILLVPTMTSLLKRSKPKGSGLSRIIKFTFSSLVPTILMAAVIYSVGPKWSEKKTVRFLDWMQRMSDTELNAE